MSLERGRDVSARGTRFLNGQRDLLPVAVRVLKEAVS